MHTIECPELKNIEVMSCDNFELLGMGGSNFDKAHGISQSEMALHHPMFRIDQVPRFIPKLQKMSLDSKTLSIISDAKILKQIFQQLKYLLIHSFQDEKISFPYWILLKLSTLEGIRIQDCSFEEIFPCDSDPSSKDRGIDMISLSKILMLWNLPNLACICKDGHQLDLTLERLESLCVWKCSKLVKLMPSSVSLNNLGYLEITSCNNMVSLISLATAKSLVLLHTLKIVSCDSIEEIISNDGHKEEQIAFRSLKVIELLDLPVLESFCTINVEFEIPMLRSVVVKGCPTMRTFTVGVSRTPKLRKVNIDTDIASEQLWEGSINTTIERIHEKKVGYSGDHSSE